MTGALIRRKEVATETGAHKGKPPREDRGRRQPSTIQDESSEKKQNKTNKNPLPTPTERCSKRLSAV